MKPLSASVATVLVLALLLANEEIQIEGSAGWAASLPTWRIEGGWLLELFWGGRTMTGYHVFIFSFVAVFFHFPFAPFWRWSWRDEGRDATPRLRLALAAQGECVHVVTGAAA